MSIWRKFSKGGSGGIAPLSTSGESGEVFSSFTYRSTNNTALDIHNNVNLLDNGGLVITKLMDAWSEYTATQSINSSMGVWSFIDTERGGDRAFPLPGLTSTYYPTTGSATNNPGFTYASGSNTEISNNEAIKQFYTNGYQLGTWPQVNRSQLSVDVSNVTATNRPSFHSLTFRRAEKFFDVITYTGDGTTNQELEHGLGVTPGFMIIFDREVQATGTSTSVNPAFVPCRFSDYGNTSFNGNQTDSVNSALNFVGGWNNTGTFNYNGLATFNNIWGTSLPDAYKFRVGHAHTNTSGRKYVAYLWANDTSTDSIIRTGYYYYGNATSTATNPYGNSGAGLGMGDSNDNYIDIGFEPSFLMVRAINRPIDLTTGSLTNQFTQYFSQFYFFDNELGGMNGAWHRHTEIANPPSGAVGTDHFNDPFFSFGDHTGYDIGNQARSCNNLIIYPRGFKIGGTNHFDQNSVLKGRDTQHTYTVCWLAIKKSMPQPTSIAQVFKSSADSAWSSPWPANVNQRLRSSDTWWRVPRDTVGSTYNAATHIFDRLRSSRSLRPVRNEEEGSGYGVGYGPTRYEFRGSPFSLLSAQNDETNKEPDQLVELDANSSAGDTSKNWVNFLLKRGKGFYDSFIYIGDGQTYSSAPGRALAHNLGVKPELIIIKPLSNEMWQTYNTYQANGITAHTSPWYLWHKDYKVLPEYLSHRNTGGNSNMLMSNYQNNLTNTNNTWPTSDMGNDQYLPSYDTLTGGPEPEKYIYLGNTSYQTALNHTAGGSGSSGIPKPYIVYLFATLPGISKVGYFDMIDPNWASIPGHTGHNDVDCGFGNKQPQFVMVWRWDQHGFPYLWTKSSGSIYGGGNYSASANDGNGGYLTRLQRFDHFRNNTQYEETGNTNNISHETIRPHPTYGGPAGGFTVVRTGQFNEGTYNSTHQTRRIFLAFVDE